MQEKANMQNDISLLEAAGDISMLMDNILALLDNGLVFSSLNTARSVCECTIIALYGHLKANPQERLLIDKVEIYFKAISPALSEKIVKAFKGAYPILCVGSHRQLEVNRPSLRRSRLSLEALCDIVDWFCGEFIPANTTMATTDGGKPTACLGSESLRARLRKLDDTDDDSPAEHMDGERGDREYGSAFEHLNELDDELEGIRILVESGCLFPTLNIARGVLESVVSFIYADAFPDSAKDDFNQQLSSVAPEKDTGIPPHTIKLQMHCAHQNLNYGSHYRKYSEITINDIETPFTDISDILENWYFAKYLRDYCKRHAQGYPSEKIKEIRSTLKEIFKRLKRLHMKHGESSIGSIEVVERKRRSRDGVRAIIACVAAVVIVGLGVYILLPILPLGHPSEIAKRGPAKGYAIVRPADSKGPPTVNTRLSAPTAIALDEAASTLYICESGKSRILAYHLASGSVEVIADEESPRAEGTPALRAPEYLAMDERYLYVSGGQILWRIERENRKVELLAGKEEKTPVSLDGVGTGARFTRAGPLACDGKNVYLLSPDVDPLSPPSASIRRIDKSSGRVDTVAALPGDSLFDAGPVPVERRPGLCVLGDRLYVSRPMELGVTRTATSFSYSSLKAELRVYRISAQGLEMLSTRSYDGIESIQGLAPSDSRVVALTGAYDIVEIDPEENLRPLFSNPKAETVGYFEPSRVGGSTWLSMTTGLALLGDEAYLVGQDGMLVRLNLRNKNSLALLGKGAETMGRGRAQLWSGSASGFHYDVYYDDTGYFVEVASEREENWLPRRILLCGPEAKGASGRLHISACLGDGGLYLSDGSSIALLSPYEEKLKPIYGRPANFKIDGVPGSPIPAERADRSIAPSFFAGGKLYCQENYLAPPSKYRRRYLAIDPSAKNYTVLYERETKDLNLNDGSQWTLYDGALFIFEKEGCREVRESKSLVRPYAKSALDYRSGSPFPWRFDWLADYSGEPYRPKGYSDGIYVLQWMLHLRKYVLLRYEPRGSGSIQILQELIYDPPLDVLEPLR
jgi:hypothetical protein